MMIIRYNGEELLGCDDINWSDSDVDENNAASEHCSGQANKLLNILLARVYLGKFGRQ